MLEKTLVVLKPHTLKRFLIGEIISRFERLQLKVVGMKMMKPDRDLLFKHYEEIGSMVTRRGEKIFQETLGMMMEGPVLAFLLEGCDSIEVVRKIVGPTEPKSAPPGTIRGDYAHLSFKYADETGIILENLVHASANKEEAAQEIALWFKEEELFN